MKKILAILLLLSSNAFAWETETGSGVVSSNETIVRTSLEATQVLQSDTLTNLYGVTILGGTVNYASFNSGGVLSTRNVVSSKDVVNIGNDQYLAWLTTSGQRVRLGVSSDNTFVLPDGIVVSANTVSVSTTLTASGNVVMSKASFDAVHVKSGGVLRSSANAVFVNASADAVSAVTTHIHSTLRVSGNATITGSTITTSSLAIPSGTGPTVDAAGEVAVDTSDDQFAYYGASKRVVTYKKSYPIYYESPAATDLIYVDKVADPITITSITCIVDPAGTGESAVIDVQECDGNGDNCSTVDTTITCGNTGAADDGSLTNPTIDAGDYIAIDGGAVTGTVTGVQVKINYTIDAE